MELAVLAGDGFGTRRIVRVTVVQDDPVDAGAAGG